MKVPKGYKDGKRLKVSVAFSPEIFNRVRSRAKKTNTGFSSVIDDLLKCGLLDIEECERDEGLVEEDHGECEEGNHGSSDGVVEAPTVDQTCVLETPKTVIQARDTSRDN